MVLKEKLRMIVDIVRGRVNLDNVLSNYSKTKEKLEKFSLQAEKDSAKIQKKIDEEKSKKNLLQARKKQADHVKGKITEIIPDVEQFMSDGFED